MPRPASNIVAYIDVCGDPEATRDHVTTHLEWFEVGFLFRDYEFKDYIDYCTRRKILEKIW